MVPTNRLLSVGTKALKAVFREGEPRDERWRRTTTAREKADSSSGELEAMDRQAEGLRNFRRPHVI